MNDNHYTPLEDLNEDFRDSLVRQRIKILYRGKHYTGIVIGFDGGNIYVDCGELAFHRFPILKQETGEETRIKIIS